MPRRPPRVPVSPIVLGEATLPAPAARYVARVLRLGRGDSFVAFDPDAALEADARVVEASARVVRADLGAPRPAAMQPRRRVTLIQATGKGDKLDAIVRDATELGATRLVPAVAARSVATPGADRSRRWRRIAVEAARQCGRGDAPQIDPVLPMRDALVRHARPPGACLVIDGDASLATFLRSAAGAPEVVVVVGPEGGLTEDEVDVARAAGLSCVSLGPLVLRTETVCAAVLGALLAVD